jgi:hypothetical protein
METEQYHLGRIAYEAYCDTTNWKSVVTGAALPIFDETPQAMKTAWITAAQAVVAERMKNDSSRIN